MSLEEELKVLETRRLGLAGDLKRLDDEIRKLQLQLWGVKEGGVVVGPHGVKYKVTEVRFLGEGSKPWIKGQRQRKDGKTFTDQIYNIYESWGIQ